MGIQALRSRVLIGGSAARIALAAISAGFLLACSDDPSGPGTTPPAEVTATAIGVAAHPLVRDVDVQLDGVSRLRVEYWTTGSPRLRRESARAAASHKIQMTRLIADALYEYEVRGIGSDGQLGEPARGQFTTGSLPAALAAIDFKASGRTTEPLTMLELRAPPFFAFVVVDDDGQVVWFWKADLASRGYTRRQNGNFVFLQGPTLTGPGVRLAEVNSRAQVVHDLSPTSHAHHDVIATPQNTLYFIAIDEQTVNDTTWAGEAIWEWTPETGSETKIWSSFDVMSPIVDRGNRSRPDDWLHANSIHIGPRGNIVMSLYFMPEVISIAPDLQSLEWRLFGNYATAMSVGDAEAYGTHTASEVSEGRVLVLDNGIDRPEGDYSRALEVEIDADAGTARKVWEFRPHPDNHARIISSARRLSNGNTLVAFGTSPGLAGSTGPIEVFEVTSSQHAVWHLTVDAHSVFRATPLSDIKGEVEVLE